MTEPMHSADPAARRERVVEQVMARIADAPPLASAAPLAAASASSALASPAVASSAAAPAASEVRVDFTPWRLPALAAAAVVLVASAAALARDAAEDIRPRTVAESLGLPMPVTRWLETGEAPPLESLGALPAPAPPFGGAPAARRP